jgi:hypothetical protein
MIFYNKPLPRKSVKTRVHTLLFTGGTDSKTDDLFLPSSVARLCYNANGSDGALKEKYGFDSYFGITALQPILKIWHLSNSVVSGYVAVLSDQKLYLYSSDSGDWTAIAGDVVFTITPTAVKYRLQDEDVLFISSPTEGMFVYDGTLLPLPDAPKLSSMAVHNERLFGVTGSDNILWFSDELDPTNWNITLDEAGYLEFADNKGKLLTVESFHDYLYVFRDNGITRVSAYARQTDFSVSQVYASSGKIYAETVVVCGGRVIFLSADGLFAFDGSSTKQLLSNLSGYIAGIDNHFSVAAFARGKYILALRMDYKDSAASFVEEENFVNNALLVVDTYGGEVDLIRGGDVTFLSADSADNSLLVCLKGYNKVLTLSDSGTLDGIVLIKNWTTPVVDFGYAMADKVLSYMVLYTKYDVDLTINVDEIPHYFPLTAATAPKRWRFASEADCLASHLVVTHCICT